MTFNQARTKHGIFGVLIKITAYTKVSPLHKLTIEDFTSWGWDSDKPHEDHVMLLRKEFEKLSQIERLLLGFE